MKNERILNHLGNVNDEYIDEAAPMKNKAKRHSRLKWGAVAACLCFIIAGVFCYKSEHPYPVKKVIAYSNSSGEITKIPHWEELNIYEQYYEIVLDDISYTARKGEIPKERLGKKLGAITARGRDEYASIAGGEANRYLSATVYEIADISPKCAVAVLYEGESVYYAAVNSYYRPKTLAQFIQDLNLQDTLVFNWVSYEHQKQLSGKHATIRFESVDSAKIWEMLLSELAAKNEYDELDFDRPKEILGISVSIPLLGYENISISVRENGYIITNILDTGKMFCIGEENTQAFVDHVLEECQGYEVVWVYENEEPIPE